MDINEAAERKYNQTMAKNKAKFFALKGLPRDARMRAEKNLLYEALSALWEKYYYPLPSPELTLQQRESFKMSLGGQIKFFFRGVFLSKKAGQISTLKMYFRPIQNVKTLKFQKAPNNVKVAYAGAVMYVIKRTGKNSKNEPIGTAQRTPIFPVKSSSSVAQKVTFPETTVAELKSLCAADYQTVLQRMSNQAGRE